MKISNVKLADIKACKNLEENIKKNILSKYYYINISMQEIIEFINRVDDYKLQIYYPDTLEEDVLIEYLIKNVEREIYNRIKSGEISIVKKAFDSYSTFLNTTRNIEKACEIIEKELLKLNIENNWKILESSYENVPIIKKIIQELANNKEKFNINLTNYPVISKLLKIHDIRKENRIIKKDEDANKLFLEKIKTCSYAENIKNFLLKNDFNERYIYIILFRCNLYSYETYTIEFLAKHFGISETRINIEQTNAIKKLFENHLIDNLIKLYPYPKETLKYFKEIYQNGFSEKIQLVVNRQTYRFQKPLTELTNLSKEEITKLIPKLNNLDQKYINDKYDYNYELKNIASCDRQATLSIVNKLIKLTQKENYEPIQAKNSNLSTALKIPKEKLQEIISRFTQTDQDFIDKHYYASFDKRKTKMTQQERTKMLSLKRDIIACHEDPTFEPRQHKNLYLRLGTTKENAEMLIKKLSESDQEKLKYWYDEKWDEKILFPQNEEKKTITSIIIYLKSFIKYKNKQKKLYSSINISFETLEDLISKLPANEKGVVKKYFNDDYTEKDLTTFANPNEAKNEIIKLKSLLTRLIKNPNYLENYGKSLHKYYKITKAELDKIIELLPENDKKIINNCYTEYYLLIKKEYDEDTKKNISIIKRKISKLIQNPNYFVELEVKKNKNKSNLYRYFKITKEELEKVIALLFEEDQIFIKTYYDTNYDLIPLLKTDKEIKSKIIIIKRTIRNLLNNPNYLIEKQQRNIKKQNLYNYYGITKENLEVIIAKLPEEFRKTLKIYYDDKYCLKKDALGYDKEEIKNYIKRIKITIRKLINDPEYLNKKATKKATNQKKTTLYEQLGITKEKLIEYIEKLDEKSKRLIKSAYDENFVIIRQKGIEREEGKRRSANLAAARNKLKRLINPTQKTPRKFKPLYNLLQIPEETLVNLLKKLSEDDQNLINIYYDKDYCRIENCNLDPKENALINSKLNAIRNKIRKMLANPDYNPSKKSEPKPKKEKITLYKLLNVTKEDLIKYIEQLDEKNKNIIKSAYDENFIIIRQKGIEREEGKRRSANLAAARNKLKRLINPTLKTSRKFKPLYTQLQISEETLIKLIAKLNTDDQNLINIYYDKDYCRIENCNLAPKEGALINSKLSTIRNKLKKMLANPDYNPSKKSEPKPKKEKITLYKLLNITKEELEVLIRKLPIESQELLKSAYNEDYIALRAPIKDPKARQLKNGKLSTIRKNLRKMLNPSTDKRQKALHETLNISEVKLSKILHKIPTGDIEFIFKHYNEDFTPKANSNLTEKEKIAARSKIYAIRKKIKKYIADPNYVPKKKTLCERLKTDYITTNQLINLLDSKEKDMILGVFDSLNDYKYKPSINTEIDDKVRSVIIPKLKRYLKNGIKTSKHKTNTNNLSIESIIQNQNYNSLAEKMNILELIIIMSLSTGETYSTKAIADYLGIDEDTTRDMIKNYLKNCQEKYNKTLEEHINSLELIRNKKEENNN